ncbi:4'-phosphopantetheinyl transferase family protein [Chitinimonas sp.]|uniref:4'-phosphopantetheinyl transferase family protein n=1 Tax=Chitinimonas sp. TaxID=1934313 RepID=UPI002F95A476
MLLLALAQVVKLHAEWSVGGVLQTDETARVAGFSRPQRRAQFLAGRWLARRLLCQAVGGAPADWTLSATAGRPPQVLGQPNWRLSVSHSGDWVACALADRPVGIDLERTNSGRDVAAMAALVCHPSEAAELGQLPAAEQEAALIAMWTRKEAWLKQQSAPFELARMRHLAGLPASMAASCALTWSSPVPGLALSLAAERVAEVTPLWPEGCKVLEPACYRLAEQAHEPSRAGRPG